LPVNRLAAAAVQVRNPRIDQPRPRSYASQLALRQFSVCKPPQVTTRPQCADDLQPLQFRQQRCRLVSVQLNSADSARMTDAADLLGRMIHRHTDGRDTGRKSRDDLCGDAFVNVSGGGSIKVQSDSIRTT